MTRRCKCGCGESLPSVAKCETPLQKKRFFGIECYVSFLKAEKVRKAEAKQKKANREFKEKVKGDDISHQLELTQKIFNRMIKLEDFYRLQYPECISCGKAANVGNLGMFCGGHLKTVGAHEELRFNTLNVHIQCNRYCNCGLSGNLTGNKHTHGYLAGLELRLGADGYRKRMEYLEKPHKNFTRDAKQLKIVRRWCSARVRWLEKEIGI